MAPDVKPPLEGMRMQDTNQPTQHHGRHVISPDDYVPHAGREQIDHLKRLAEPLRDATWTSVNSTLDGGGVAELLRGVVPFAAGLGIDARWHVMEGHNGFFCVTKKFHNMLQGLDEPITTQDIFDSYLGTIEENARKTSIEADLVVVHDPQPVALAAKGVLFGNVLWRCHIDTSAPNPVIWRFLLPYVNHFAGAIFTMPEFVGPGLQTPIYEVWPCIDPCAGKNRQRSRAEALATLEPLLQSHNVDPGRPILAAVSRYDIHKNQARILQAFRRLQAERRYDRPPYLIFLGNTVADDPEGEQMLAALLDQASDDADVRFWLNVENNDEVVGALMRVARGLVHISTREGFGLVVSEALWQGTPVIGSRVGGIVRQVIDGQTGYLVDARDVDAIAARMARLLGDPETAARLGAQGREHVRRNFLLPELIRRYLVLMRFYTGVDEALPDFRLNGIAYTEKLTNGRRLHPDLKSPPHWTSRRPAGGVLDIAPASRTRA